MPVNSDRCQMRFLAWGCGITVLVIIVSTSPLLAAAQLSRDALLSITKQQFDVWLSAELGGTFQDKFSRTETGVIKGHIVWDYAAPVGNWRYAEILAKRVGAENVT